MMQLEEELAGFSPDEDTLLTIGVFDGVHLGHRALISSLVEHANERRLIPGVITFRQHPQELVSPRAKLPFLTSLEERRARLMAEGARLVVLLSFTTELAGLSARQFVSLLQKHLRMRGLVIGPDCALGKGRAGNIERLRQLGREMGFTVNVVPPARLDGEVVSSTAIRKALAEGDVRRAAKLAGRPFSLCGSVTTGDGRGKGLGFPTANLITEPDQALPANGVYACWAYIGDKRFQSLTNVGTCPTFGGISRRVETFIIDFRGDLYDRALRVDFVDRLRDEHQFGSAEELKQQMAKDVKKGKAILESGS